MVAMHLGSQLQVETMNHFRYAQPLEMIVRRNPYSLLRKFVHGELSQSYSYITDVNLTYLTPTSHNYLIDEEGRESEKILRGLLTTELTKNKNIKKNKNGTISFSEHNLEYIASKYPNKYGIFEEKCLEVTGLHGVTRLYSAKKVVESDHTIPHNVWKSTTNPKMKKVVTGG